MFGLYGAFTYKKKVIPSTEQIFYGLRKWRIARDMDILSIFYLSNSNHVYPKILFSEINKCVTDYFN